VETTSLYRAVTPAELRDLARRAWVFRNPPGVEVKYFSETAEGAASYAQHTFGTGLYEGPYTIVSTEIASHLITPLMRATTDRGILTVVVPTDLLLRLTSAHPLPFTPLPHLARG
jgi:hypothetical protein